MQAKTSREYFFPTELLMQLLFKMFYLKNIKHKQSIIIKVGLI